MSFKTRLARAFLFLPALLSHTVADNNWIVEKHKGYSIHYTHEDKAGEKEYRLLIDKGILAVGAFFKRPYKNDFDVFIYPGRRSFDTALQTLFKNPGFTSECWLVATGDGRAINILSPGTWDKEGPCEGKYTAYADRFKTQKLITHELVHVFHGQLNIDPTLSDPTNSTDWFTEGLAFYASGQLDDQAIKDVRKALAEKKQPADLHALSVYGDVALRYSLSGSLVQYIDKRYGRSALVQLMAVGKNKDILARLKTTESPLLHGWEKDALNDALPAAPYK